MEELGSTSSAGETSANKETSKEEIHYFEFLAGFVDNLENRLAMPRDGYPTMDTCPCEPCTSVVVTTLWEGHDKERRVITCPKPPCGFRIFVDGMITGHAKAVIEHLYKTVEQLVFEFITAKSYISCLENEVARLKVEVNKDDPNVSVPVEEMK